MLTCYYGCKKVSFANQTKPTEVSVNQLISDVRLFYPGKRFVLDNTMMFINVVVRVLHSTLDEV